MNFLYELIEILLQKNGYPGIKLKFLKKII